MTVLLMHDYSLCSLNPSLEVAFVRSELIQFGAGLIWIPRSCSPSSIPPADFSSYLPFAFHRHRFLSPAYNSPSFLLLASFSVSYRSRRDDGESRASELSSVSNPPSQLSMGRRISATMKMQRKRRVIVEKLRPGFTCCSGW